MDALDHTHDPALRSWLGSANGHAEFPIQNLPLGCFSPPDSLPRGGVAIGDHILDLRAVHEAGLLSGDAAVAAEAASGRTLNPMLALGADPRRALRHALSALLADGAPDLQTTGQPDLLHRAAACALHLPVNVGDYTDFYAGIHHATTVGRLLRPDAPLLPNYKHIPIGYHGRASSLLPSGGPVRRPRGQRKAASEAAPSFGPSRNLDYELELGMWIGEGNALGESIPIAQAGAHIAGYCLLNDWSARDIQGWEYQPLGPFLGKSFATTVSPWMVTPEALAPFRAAQPSRPEGDPVPLAYLLDDADQRHGAFDIALEVLLLTPGLREQGRPAHRLSIGNALSMYWTMAQLVAHHASNGCNLRPGDLFGTGTLSSSTPDGYGSLLEISQGGRQPVSLPSGETRRFLEDGDEVILCARARREGAVTIGFGECRGRIVSAS